MKTMNKKRSFLLATILFLGWNVSLFCPDPPQVYFLGSNKLEKWVLEDAKEAWKRSCGRMRAPQAAVAAARAGLGLYQSHSAPTSRLGSAMGLIGQAGFISFRLIGIAASLMMNIRIVMLTYPVLTEMIQQYRESKKPEARETQREQQESNQSENDDNKDD